MNTPEPLEEVNVIAMPKKEPFLPGEYKLNQLTPYMFELPESMDTTKIVEKFGFKSVFEPGRVDTAKMEAFHCTRKEVNDPGVYIGPFDENGQRSGVGTCTWKNGAVYEGEWRNNLRHGNGQYTCPDYEYYGQWKFDMRHGRCRYNWTNQDPD